MLEPNRATDDKTMMTIKLNEANLNTCPLKSAMRLGCPLSALLFNIVIKTLAITIREGNEMKRILIEKKEVKLTHLK